MKRALIIGISGQDGAYLARLLQARGVEVWGVSRGKSVALKSLGVADALRLEAWPHDQTEIAALFDRTEPDEIYHLAGRQAALQGFGEDAQGDSLDVSAWLDALRRTPATRFFAATSAAALFAGTDGAVTVSTPFVPIDRFGHAQAEVVTAVAAARQQHGLFAVSGLLFAHDSRFGPNTMLTRRIIGAVQACVTGQQSEIQLIHANRSHDIGWAPEYVDAMTRMLAVPVAADRVIATGTLISVQQIIEAAFGYFTRDWRDFVRVEAESPSTAAVPTTTGDPADARSALDWRAMTHGDELITTLCEGLAAG